MPDELEDVRPMFELRSRNYIVTGGAQGMWFVVTRAICEMGGNVAIIDVQSKPAEGFQSLTERYGVRTAYIQTDVTKQDDLNAGFAKALEVLGSIGYRMAAYNASKGDVLMLSKALAVELAPHNIRVNWFSDPEMTRSVRQLNSKREGESDVDGTSDAAIEHTERSHGSCRISAQ
ncbi:hypothetical protein SUNI508_08899 [Seiridium unicorne]|uniref:Uncharacterized protein n=1 Tax=Seiridium unicorne TaxID=138068 RepID=A0ABR2URQ3_9PEZI